MKNLMSNFSNQEQLVVDLRAGALSTAKNFRALPNYCAIIACEFGSVFLHASHQSVEDIFTRLVPDEKSDISRPEEVRSTMAVFARATEKIVGMRGKVV